MECPICGAELTHHDIYGRLAAHQDGRKLGDIYECPNGREQDGSCASESFRVAGSFYTIDPSDELHKGYPC